MRDRVGRRLWGVVALVMGLLVLVVGLTACGSTSSSASASLPSGSAMPSMTADTIVGAGATFPFPIYSKWGTDYQNAQGVKLNYQAIGSGGGISAIEAKTVDFGASDAPLSASDLDTNGLAQWPQIIGGTVPSINVSGVPKGKLKLTGQVLANIFLGQIRKWNDPAITGLNPGVTLPGEPIVVVHRSDGSGTTWIFTNYLSAVSPTWKSQVGADKEVAWPTGLAGKGNSGVAAIVQKTEGAIGYNEYAYVIQNDMNNALVQNRDGKFVAPSLTSFAAAAANADWQAAAPSFDLALVNEPGANTWPIAGASFILMQKDQADAARAKMTLSFFDWAFKNGADSAKSLDYVPIPQSVYQTIEQTWTQEITSGGSPVWP
jgi:phosphate transport system substrate-binding protein